MHLISLGKLNMYMASMNFSGGFIMCCVHDKTHLYLWPT